jgi:DNA (cytosine-5)-methyltransferase 1
MRIGSLFSGAGGLDMAVEAVFGGETLWHAEIDKAASKVLAHRWPNVPNLGDITQVDWENWKPLLEVDILCGGFPCQDVSAAGKRAGIKAGTRSGLWAVFADAIEALQPRIVVVENVRGLLSATAHRDVESDNAVVGIGGGVPVLRAAGAVVGTLSDLGYSSRWATVSAASVGAPHRRERVFIVATDTKRGSGARIANTGGNSEADSEGRQAVLARGFSDSASLSGSTPVGFNTGGASGAEAGAYPGDRSGDHRGERADGVTLLPTPRSSDCFGAGHHGDGGMDLRTTVTLLPSPMARDYKGVFSPNRQGGDDLTRAITESMPAQGDSGWCEQCYSEHGVSDCLADEYGYPVGKWGKYEPAIRRWEQLTRPAPPPTEPNKNGNPRLAAAFSEWLMGWPDGWATDPAIGISRNDQLRIVGNGVCPQQAAAALRFLLEVTG